MADDDGLEPLRIEQHLALMSDAEFAALIARTRAPVLATEKDVQTVDTLGDPELRKMLRQLLGKAEPEPKRGNHVPAEGGNPKPPPISPEQYNRDFLRRVTGAEPATHGFRLPDPEDTP